MNLKLIDEWENPYSLRDKFRMIMMIPSKFKGKPITQFDIKALPIGEKVTFNKPTSKRK